MMARVSGVILRRYAQFVVDRLLALVQATNGLKVVLRRRAVRNQSSSRTR